MKRGRLKKEFLLYFRLFFVLALAVIVLMGAAQYFYSYRSIEKNTLSGGENTLALLQNTHEMILRQVDSSVQALQTNAYLLNFPDYYKNNNQNLCINLIAQVKSAAASNPYIKSFCVYFRQEGFVVASDVGYTSLEWYYDADFLTALDASPWPYSKVNRRVIESRFATSAETGEALTFVRTLPVYSSTKAYRAYIVVNVDAKAVDTALENVNGAGNVSMLVLDDYGNLIDGVGPARKDAAALAALSPAEPGHIETGRATLTAGESIVQTVRSDRGWIYFFVQPARDMMGGISALQNRLLVLCAAALLLSVCCSLLFSWRMFEPLRIISGRFSAENPEDETPYKKETERILHQIDAMIARNRQLEAEKPDERLSPAALQYPEDIENRLLRALKNRSETGISQELDRLMLLLVRAGQDERTARAFYERLWNVVGRAAGAAQTPFAARTLPEMDAALENLCAAVTEMMTPPDETNCSQLVRDVTAYIDANLSEDLRIDMLAEKFYVSPSHLRKVFRSEMNRTVKEYIDCRRLEEAKCLLRDETLQIQQIALQVGFLYPQSFTAFFRSMEGKTPGEYRAAMQSEAHNK